MTWGATITVGRSRTAEPVLGHRRHIGADRPRTTLAPRTPRGCTIGSGTQAQLVNPAVAEARQRELLRQALYLNCERAPEFGPAHRNLVQP